MKNQVCAILGGYGDLPCEVQSNRWWMFWHQPMTPPSWSSAKVYLTSCQSLGRDHFEDSVIFCMRLCTDDHNMIIELYLIDTKRSTVVLLHWIIDAIPNSSECVGQAKTIGVFGNGCLRFYPWVTHEIPMKHMTRTEEMCDNFQIFTRANSAHDFISPVVALKLHIWHKINGLTWVSPTSATFVLCVLLLSGKYCKALQKRWVRLLGSLWAGKRRQRDQFIM